MPTLLTSTFRYWRTQGLPRMHFTLCASSSVVDLLGALHDFIWFRCFRRQHISMVVDYMRNAYTSLVHDTLMFLLQLARFSDAIVDILLLANVRMGGCGGVCGALVFLLSGVAVGCSASAMKFCVVVEVPVFLALLRVPPCWGPGGPLLSAAAHGRHHVVHRLPSGFTNLCR